MDGPVPRWRGKSRCRSPATRRQIAYCLRQSFPLDDSGTFTSLLRAIDAGTGEPRG